MGTIAELAVVHRDERYAHTAIDAAIRELRYVDRTMSRFRTDSDVGRANQAAARQPVSVTPETAHVLERALRWAEASEGEFDPCLGKAVALWDVGRRRTPPPAERVRALAGRELYRSLELGEWRGRPTVVFRDPDVALDLGGIAKGYGVDRAVAALRAYGIGSGLVNVGGDLYALGRSQDGDPWRVGIRNPDRPAELIDTFEVEDCAVATSGDYIQYFRYGDRRYHHMLDPRTGEPKRSSVRSVTVMAETCLAADAAATTIFGMPRARAEQLLRAGAPGARIVRVI
jgi:thiamine biosynthesis lipoprotein